MCDIKVLTIDMHINLKHMDGDKIGDFIYFISYKTLKTTIIIIFLRMVSHIRLNISVTYYSLL